MLNISNRFHQLVIGDEDWSNSLVEITPWASTPIDSTGLVKTTATIKLAETRDNPDSLDDRLNADFRVGQPIRIDVADETTGELKRHPSGALRILSASYDYETRTTEINAGCLITLLSYRRPTDSNEAGVEIKGAARNTLVAKLLQLAGIKSISNPYQLPYPINYPINIDGSYLEAAGKMLYSAGYFGWINKEEVFKIKPVYLAGSTNFTINIGGDAGDELWYRRLSNSEGPREIIKVQGVTQVAREPEYPITSFSEEYGPTSAIDPDVLGNGTTIFEQRYIVEEESQVTTTIRQPRGLAVPDTDSANKTSLTTSEIAVENKSYESGKKGKLLSTLITTQKLSEAVLAEYIKFKEEEEDVEIGSSGLFLAELTGIDYSYDAKERLKSITTKKFEALGALLAGTNEDWSTYASIPNSLRISEIKIESWEENKADNSWTHTTRTSQSLSRGKPEAITEEMSSAAKIALTSGSFDRQKSNSGQATPPAAERRPPKVTYESLQVCGKALFGQYGGNPYQERERTYQIDYLMGRSGGKSDSTLTESELKNPDCTDEQCSRIARIEGKLLYGRFKGQDIGLNLKDEFFNWEPLMRLKCIEPNGAGRVFALDDAHWIIQGDRTICNFGGIYLGSSTPTPDTEIGIILNASADIGSTLLQVEPLSESIPAGATITVILSPEQLVGQVAGNAKIGDTTLSITPILVALPTGVTVKYKIPVLQLPYVEVIETAINLKVFGSSTYYPYSLLPTPYSLRGGIRTSGSIQKVTRSRGGVIIGGETSVFVAQRDTRGGLKTGGAVDYGVIILQSLTSHSGVLMGGMSNAIIATASMGGVLVGGKTNIFILRSLGGIRVGGSAEQVVAGDWAGLSNEDWDTLSSFDWNSLI